MDVPHWTTALIVKIPAGTCFVYSEGGVVHVAMALKPGNESFGWIDLCNLSAPEKSRPGRLIEAHLDHWGWGLRLDGARADFEVESIHPNAPAHESLWTPGSLVIHESNYWVLGFNDQGDLMKFNLVNGTFSHANAERMMAIVDRWRIVCGDGADTREICKVGIRLA